MHLRDNLKFQPLAPVNGRAVTGDDVKKSFELGFADQQSYYANQNRFIDKIEVMPGNIIKFTSKFPNAMRFDPFQILIMAPEAIAAFGDQTARKAVGSGPLMLDGDYNPDGVTNLKRHPDFMIKGRPFPEKATFRSITDQAAHTAAFRSVRSTTSRRRCRSKSLSQRRGTTATSRSCRSPLPRCSGSTRPATRQ